MLDLLAWLSIVPCSIGLIIGVVGTALAVRHGDYGYAAGCLLLGILSATVLYLGSKELSS